MYHSNVLSSDLFISASSRRVVPSRCRYLLPPHHNHSKLFGDLSFSSLCMGLGTRAAHFSCAIANQSNTCPCVHATTWFHRKPRAHSPGHAPTVWRATLVAKWHITARLAVNALPGQHKPPAHDIREMIRFVTEIQIFCVG